MIIPFALVMSGVVSARSWSIYQNARIWRKCEDMAELGQENEISLKITKKKQKHIHI